MKRIKIIDVPRYEADPKVIVEHLTTFLKNEVVLLFRTGLRLV